MSRLEKAIEIAARERNGASEITSASKPKPASPPEVKTLKKTVPPRSSIQVDNPFLVMANDQDSPAARFL